MTQGNRICRLSLGFQTDRLRKENAALRWKLAMAGANNSGSLQGQVADDASVMLKMKESKIRILEEQVCCTVMPSWAKLDKTSIQIASILAYRGVHFRELLRRQ